MKNASYCVSYGKEGRLQQNEQKNSFCYSPFVSLTFKKCFVCQVAAVGIGFGDDF